MANSFDLDLVKDARKVKKQNKRQKRKTQDFAHMLQQAEPDQDGESYANYYSDHLNEALVRMRKVRISFRDQALNILFRCVRKRKGHRSMQRLADFYSA